MRLRLQSVFSIWNHHKCLSQLFLLHLNNYAIWLLVYDYYKCFYSVVGGTDYRYQILTSIDLTSKIVLTQSVRHIEPMFLSLVQWWASIGDGGPALNPHWFNVLCLLWIIKHVTSLNQSMILRLTQFQDVLTEPVCEIGHGTQVHYKRGIPRMYFAK